MKKLRSPQFRLTTRAKYWWLLVASSAIIVGFVFAAGWQNYRENANDPQVQYTEEIVAALEQGASPEAFSGSNPVDPRKSLGVFLIVTDDKKKVVASTMQLDNPNTPVPSDKTFSAADKGQQRVSWKPHNDAKVAIVMQKYKGGYVMVGRSMKEADSRIKDLALLSLGAFLALTAISTIAVRMALPAAKRPEAESPTPLEALKFDEATPVERLDDEATNAPAKTEFTAEQETPASEMPAATKTAKRSNKKKKSGKKPTRG